MHNNQSAKKWRQMMTKLTENSHCFDDFSVNTLKMALNVLMFLNF